MAELIDKWEVFNKLIRLESNYQFYKDKWDADVLYRRICELEIGIGMAPGVELVRCKDCAWCHKVEDLNYCENPNTPWIDDPDFDDVTVADNDFCSYGEREPDA